MPRTDDAQLPATFNRLAWSNLAAQSAEQIALAAAPIVAVLSLGVGEGETGLLQTALTAPFVLFAIPAGVLADRIPRRVLMAAAEAARALALLAILAAIGFGRLTLPGLAMLGFIAVCGTVMFSVAAPALVPSLVTKDLLPAANARIELARTVAFASGPALGGLLVGWIGGGPAFGCAAALSVVAAVFMAGIDEPARTPPPRRHPLQDIIRCCGRCSSPSSSSTPHRSCCSPSSSPMPCIGWSCRPQASAPRCRCTASAWWWARCWRRG
jgi:MFS family permease